jgi:hypothetical protein
VLLSTTSRAEVVTNTWTLFGFTEGSDTSGRGERTIFVDSFNRFSKLHRNYLGQQSYLGVAHGTSTATTTWISISGEIQRGLANPTPSGLSALALGGTVGLKYQILDRSLSGIGLAAQIEPFWQKAARPRASPNQNVDIGSDLKLIIDAALVPHRLFAAINLTYTPELVTLVDRSIQKTASLELGAAAAIQATPGVFVGGEIRSVFRYAALLPSSSADRAVFAGPTLYFTIGENAYAGLAWSTQVGGLRQWGIGLNFTGFERHQFRLKFGADF